MGGAAALAQQLIAGAAGKLVTNPSVVESMMKRSTPAPLPAPFLQPGGSGQMPDATNKDLKNLPKIMGPALLKAEPRPAARQLFQPRRPWQQSRRMTSGSCG
jgi:hypothetical protein